MPKLTFDKEDVDLEHLTEEQKLVDGLVYGMLLLFLLKTPRNEDALDTFRRECIAFAMNNLADRKLVIVPHEPSAAERIHA